jgi:5'(3')-deoxyribonucleotidase
MQIMQKIILIDCDGVLSNFNEMALGAIKNHFNIDVTCDGMNWDYFDYPNVKSVSGQLWNYICNTPGVIRGLKKYDYADELIHRLREIGQVVCLTSIPRSKFYPGERFEWLIEELGFDRKDIILGHRKYLVNGDVLIDDKPSNVVSWAQRCYGVPVLWSTPGWCLNARETDPENIFRTGSVDALINHLIKVF